MLLSALYVHIRSSNDSIDSLAPLHIRVDCSRPALGPVHRLVALRIRRVCLVGIAHVARQSPGFLRLESVSSASQRPRSLPLSSFLRRIVKLQIHAPIQRNRVHRPSLRLKGSRHEPEVSSSRTYQLRPGWIHTSSASRAKSPRRRASPSQSSGNFPPAHRGVPPRSRRGLSALWRRRSDPHRGVRGGNTPCSRRRGRSAGRGGGSTSPAALGGRRLVVGEDGPEAGRGARPTSFCVLVFGALDELARRGYETDGLSWMGKSKNGTGGGCRGRRVSAPHRWRLVTSFDTGTAAHFSPSLLPATHSLRYIADACNSRTLPRPLRSVT